MSKSIGIRWVKYFSIFMTLFLLFGCTNITPVKTITQDSSGKTLSTTTEYQVILEGNYGRVETFKDLPSAQQRVASFYQMDMLNKRTLEDAKISGQINDPLFWFHYSSVFNIGLQMLQPRPTETKVVTVNSPTNTQSNRQTSVQQDITSTANSATGNPNQNFSLSDNFTLNGMDPSTKTGLAAAVAIGVIGGITAGVVTAVNNQAQQQQEEQKKNNDWTTLLLLSQQKGGGSNCIPNPQNPC